MANYLKMTKISAILTLKERNWSYRRISRELGIHLDTVRKYANAGDHDSKQVNAPTGSDTPKQVTNAPAGSQLPKPATHPHTGSQEQQVPGPKSDCEPYRETIEQKLEDGLTRQRIWQDLRDEHDAKVSYHSVRRFVNRLGKNSPVPFRRLECKPGKQAQIDFGVGAPIITKDGKRKKTYVIRVVLCFSRKSYSETIFNQTTDNFISCLENVFLAFWRSS
jgi:transposase